MKKSKKRKKKQVMLKSTLAINKKKKKTNYIDNDLLFQEVKNYLKSLKDFKDQKMQDKPKIPEYIGQSILLIAERLASRPNFSNYSYRDEMVSDGIENCLLYMENFDPDKSNNPFAYFTQIIYYAYLRRIQKEKKQNFIKMKITQEMDNKGFMREWTKNIGANETGNPYADAFKLSEKDIEYFEKLGTNPDKPKQKKKKIKKSKLDEFFKED